MARILIYKICPLASNGNVTTEVYWDTVGRAQVALTPANSNTCSVSNLTPGTLLDTWFEGSTRVDIKAVWNGTGRPPRQAWERVETPNAAGGGNNEGPVTPCGLMIEDVIVTDNDITILTSGYSGAVEYSINNFVTVQDSNTFPNPGAGSYIALARAKR